jgi:D-alanyl-D-alanine carboxypeptidase
MIGRLQATLDKLVASDSTIPGTAVHLESPAMGLSWSGAAGINDRSTRTKLLPNQPMRMASNTKTYTATAILRLAEDGRLSIDDPIAKYLSDEMQALLKSGGYDPAAITIRQVLRHVSGQYDYGADSAYAVAVVADPAHRWTRREQVAFAISHGKPQGPPGQVFHYSDTGYILLGEIIERLTGLTFGAALRSLIDYQAHQLYWTWLESIDPDPWYGSNRAHQYFGGTDTWSFDPSFDLYGGGGLAAPVKDMALFTRALVCGEIYRKPATVDLMLERSGPKPERDYRMGIYRTGPDGLEGFGHTGFWGTFSFYFPEADLAVAGSITEHFATGKMNGLLAELVRAVRETP